MSEKEHKSIRSSVRSVNKLLAQQTKRDNRDRLEELPSNWLLAILITKTTGYGYVRYKHDRLTVTQPNNYHRDICNNAALSIFLDATQNAENLALKLGISRDQILVISQPLPDYSNLTITQVTGMGNPSKSRRDCQQAQIDALTSHLAKKYNNKLGIIDKKRREGTGLWWRDNRGTNRYQNCDAIVAIGAPVPNLGALAAEFSILAGRQVAPTSKDPDWIAYIQRQIEAETIQLIGRVRAQHRPDQRIHIYWVVDRDDLPLDKILGAYPGCKFDQRQAIDICVDAATSFEQLKYSMAQALMSGKDWTITQLAKAFNLSPGRVSQLISKLGAGGKKSLAVLTKGLYSTAKLSRQENPTENECPPSKLIDWANLIAADNVEYTTTTLTNPDIGHDELASEILSIASTLTTRQMRGLFMAMGKSLTDRFIDYLHIGIAKFGFDPVPG